MSIPKTFADISDREWALETIEAQALLESLPSSMKRQLIQYFLNPSNTSTKELLQYFSANSPFLNLIQQKPGTALAFETLYTRNASNPIDQYCINCKAGFQIHKRLFALEENLPSWFDHLLDTKDTILVDNIGSGTGRDTIGALSKNLHLAEKVKVRHIDPDAQAISISQQLAHDSGIAESISFHVSKFSDVPPANADMVLLIGILCPLDRRVSKVVLRNVIPYVQKGGIVIFSTALYNMVIDDPLADSIMRLNGWHMIYKSEDESVALATSLGWRILGMFFDEPLHHHCMVVAEIP